MLRSFVCGAALVIGTVAPAFATDDDGGWRSADRPMGRDDQVHHGDDGWHDDHHGRFAPADEEDRVILRDDTAPTRPYWGTTRPYWGTTQPYWGPTQPSRDWRDPQRAGSVRDVPVRRGGSHRGGHDER